jgi:hypothetical protein
MNAQIRDPNQLDMVPQDLPKGNIVSIKETEYLAVNRFGELVKERLTSEGTAYFNKRNLLDSAVYYSKNDEDVIKEAGYYKLFYQSNNHKEVVYKTIHYEVRRSKIKQYQEEEDLYVEIFKYDLLGNVIEKERYEKDKLIEKELATYSKENKLLNYQRFGNDGALEYEVNYTYGSKGNIIEQISYGRGRTYENKKNKYNARNQILETTCYDINNSPSYKITYKYNSVGKLFEVFSDYINQSSGNKTVKYNYTISGGYQELEYGGDGNLLTGSKRYDGKGRILEQIDWYSKNTYVYNEQGQQTQETNYHFVYDSNKDINAKKIRSIDRTTYEFDKQGNWVKSIYSYTDAADDENLMIPKKYKITDRVIQYR